MQSAASEVARARREKNIVRSLEFGACTTGLSLSLPFSSLLLRPLHFWSILLNSTGPLFRGKLTKGQLDRDEKVISWVQKNGDEFVGKK